MPRPNTSFSVGDEVEVWLQTKYRHAVVHSERNTASTRVVRFTHSTPSVSGQLQEVSTEILRPPPPAEEQPTFRLCDEVDAFWMGCWRIGVIMCIFSNPQRFSVHLRHMRKQLRFDESELRRHREIVDGNWYPRVQRQPPPKGKIFEALVEQCWYPVNVIRHKDSGHLLIQYTTRRRVDQRPIGEPAESHPIRRLPSATLTVNGFDVGDLVEAFHEVGWFQGAITRVYQQGSYSISILSLGTVLKFAPNDIRPRVPIEESTMVTVS